MSKVRHITFVYSMALMLIVFIGCQDSHRSSQYYSKPDIVDTAIQAGSFNTLVAALKAADLADALNGPGPFTVFAPTDAAFAKLPAGTLDNLLLPKNKTQLADILKYHVVADQLSANEVTTRHAIPTLLGKQLMVRMQDRSVMVNDATIEQTDIICKNGIIHVIDTVILP